MDPTAQLILKLEKSSWAKLKDNSRADGLHGTN